MTKANIKDILKNKNVKKDIKTITEKPKNNQRITKQGKPDQRAKNEGRPKYKDDAQLSKKVLMLFTNDELEKIDERVKLLNCGSRLNYFRTLLKGDIPNF